MVLTYSTVLDVCQVQIKNDTPNRTVTFKTNEKRGNAGNADSNENKELPADMAQLVQFTLKTTVPKSFFVGGKRVNHKS